MKSKSKQQTMQVEMKEAEIAAAIQENDQQELERKLQLGKYCGKPRWRCYMD